jgi:hypothetical protein
MGRMQLEVLFITRSMSAGGIRFTGVDRNSEANVRDAV